MKFLMFVCWDAERMDAQTEPDPNETPDEEGFPWLDDLQARRIWVTGDQLAPPRRARSVRVRDGKALVTDGPFAETKEAVGGFDTIECGSLEEAVEIAAGHPIAQMVFLATPGVVVNRSTSGLCASRLDVSGLRRNCRAERRLPFASAIVSPREPSSPPRRPGLGE